MVKVFALLVLGSICVIINAQETASNEKCKWKEGVEKHINLKRNEFTWEFSVREMKVYYGFYILAYISLNNPFNFSPLNRAALFGQPFDEVVVSSDLNVRRKSKENRQSKRLLSNVPSGTTGPPEKSTAIASRLVSADGSRITPESRERRDIATVRRR